MTTNYPVASLFSLQLSGGKQGRFTVRCPHCNTLHRHRWYGNHVTFDISAPCSHELMYRVDLRAALALKKPKHDVSQPHIVSRVSGEHCDDNALDDPVPNWTELGKQRQL